MLRVLFVVFFLFPSVIEASSFSVEIDVGPPPLHFVKPPEVVVVPNLVEYVYVIPDVSGIYFYEGHWYRHHRGRWFRSDLYDGPWVYIYLTDVPVVLIELTSYYPPKVVQYRIHYSELSRNWRQWGHNRHWHRHDWYRCGWDRPDRRVRFEISSRDNNEVSYRYRPAPVERFNRPSQNYYQNFDRGGNTQNPRTWHYQYGRTIR